MLIKHILLQEVTKLLIPGILALLLLMVVLGIGNYIIDLGVIKKSIHIDASPEEVFDFTGDWRNLPEYQAGIKDWQPTTETTRGEGARFSYSTTEMGMEFEIETEIVEVTPTEERVWQTVSGADIEAKWRFESLNGETNVTYILDYNLPVPLIGNILDALVVRERRERWVEDMLQNLKTLIEE